MSDINVEFSHIYTNESASSEHYKAAMILKDKLVEWRAEDLDVASCVLIDDYNPDEHLLDIEGYLRELGHLGVRPDYLILESSLPLLKDRLLNDMSGKLQRQYSTYISSNKKCPCSFLVAAWHLMRLGVYPADDILRQGVCESEISNFAGKEILTILPYRFGGVEKRALDIIRSTPYYESIKDRLGHIFF